MCLPNVIGVLPSPGRMAKACLAICQATTLCPDHAHKETPTLTKHTPTLTKKTATLTKKTPTLTKKRRVWCQVSVFEKQPKTFRIESRAKTALVLPLQTPELGPSEDTGLEHEANCSQCRIEL